MISRLALAVVFALLSTLAEASPLGPDGENGRTYPGKFVWFDLATEDLAGSREFYGAVFDWQFRPVENAPASYTLIEHEGGKIGGMFRHARPPGALAGSRWLALMSVPDAAKAAQYVTEHGGEVLLAPKTVAGRGTHAVFRDPEGAVFGVLAASDGDPPDDPVTDGDVFWLDLFAPDPAKAASFYAGLGGYAVSESTTASGRRRWVLSAEGFARAGIVLLPPGKAGAGWLPYILVEDVPDTLDRVRRAGGKVVVEPRPDLLDGKLAVISDPLGGVVGIVDWEVRVDPRGPIQ
ncbi:MAG TPA: VOC family protein [Stellaceae bacterium]|nr:VOC family protein [Stellaceae bacterium]